MIAILRMVPIRRKKRLDEIIVTSFCNRRPNNTRIPISATDPARATVVTVVTVETVTVEIIFPLINST
jgi:hypothetical protein